MSGLGRADARRLGVSTRIDQQQRGTTIHARARDAEIKVEIPRPPEHESLGVLAPWSPTRFQCTVKDIGRPAGGTLRLRGSTYELTDAFAVLDHGRGKWPYRMTWSWGAGCGKDVAIHIGGTWTDGTGKDRERANPDRTRRAGDGSWVDQAGVTGRVEEARQRW